MTRVLSAIFRTNTVHRSVSIAQYWSVWRQRRQLAKLTPEQLRDAGISPQDAARESARPFWDLPH